MVKRGDMDRVLAHSLLLELRNTIDQVGVTRDTHDLVVAEDLLAAFLGLEREAFYFARGFAAWLRSCP